MTSKTEFVKSLFEVPEKYLGPREFDIRVRIETVQQFTEAQTFDRVLDIGCGNGAISLPLLERCRRLTLLDLSRKMLKLAQQRIPAERLSDVELIDGDFLGANLPHGSFDLILCIGILAHVDSAAAVISRVAQLAKPGSRVVLEFTDSFHFWGVPVVLYQKLLKLLKPQPYSLNRLKRQEVLEMCRNNGLNELALYRYGLPPLGTSKISSQDGMYRMVRRWFGSSEKNRNRWMGNQFIYLFQKAETIG